MDRKVCFRDVKNDINILTKVIDPEDFVQRVNSLLTNKQTRCSGINILQKTLDYLNIAILEHKANLWITLLFKAYVGKEFNDNGAFFFHILDKFIFRMQESTNLYKSFENNHLRKLYEILSISSEITLKYAMPCLETCLRIYPVTDASSKDLVGNILNKLINVTDNELSMSVGKCKQLLCVSRCNQEQNANQWEKYQQSLLDSLSEALDDMFSKCPQIGSLNNYQHKNVHENNEPVQLTSKYIRFHNLNNYLITALREPFPVTKRIKLKPILNLIRRGFGVNYLILQQNPIAENIELSLLLHKLHLDLLNLLSALLIVCRCHLKPYFQESLDLLTDTLKGLSKVMESKNLNENENSVETALLILRSKIYDTISYCLTILKIGCRIPSIMEALVNEIFKDITPIEKIFTFEVLNNTTKNLKKKTMPKIQNVHSHLAKLYTDGKNMKRTAQKFRGSSIEVCISALRCLQKLFEKSINFLKPTLIKLIQTNVIRICCQLYQYRPINATIVYLYDDESCRLELLKTLYMTYVTAHYLDVEFSEITVKILQIAQCSDESLGVRDWCSNLLQIFEKIQHPQKESLLTPPDLSLSINFEPHHVKNNQIFHQFVQNSNHDLRTNTTLCQNTLNDNHTIEPLMNETIIDEDEMNERNSQIKFIDDKSDDQNLVNKAVENDNEVFEKIEYGQQISGRQSSSNDCNNIKVRRNELNKQGTDKHEEQAKYKEQCTHENDEDTNDTENAQKSKKLKLADESTHSELNNSDNSNNNNLLAELLNLFVDEPKSYLGNERKNRPILTIFNRIEAHHILKIATCS